MAQDIQSIVDEREKEQLLSIPAQRLIEKLSLLKNRKESSRKRWFWELLQNASDYNQTVAVRLTVNQQQVVFEHDGSPFSITDVLNMISPDSNKRDDEKHADNIGKFGTGLVSTHILSSEMEVKGICLEKEEYYRFKVVLDRSPYLVKDKLIEAINTAKDNFKASLSPTSLADGFQTSITYQLGSALPSLPVIKAEEIDLEYLYEVLPYTLCFMPKVREVTIRDERDGVSVFSIKRKQGRPDDVTFCIERNGKPEQLTFAYFTHNGVSSVYRYAEGVVLPFPAGISRIFCGLPLIGTESIGLPFLLNSFKFEPTTEREGVELEPGSNDTNRSLLSESIILYKKILDRVQNEKLSSAYTLTTLSRKYNGTQASNTQFINQFVPKYKAEILLHSIVENEKGEFIPFSQVRLPFFDSKTDTELYKHSRFIASVALPRAC